MNINFANENPERLLFALLLAAIVACVAYRGRALTSDGAVAAVCVGGAIVAGSGWWAGGALILFFTSSTALSKLRVSRSSEIRQQRGHRRDATQVLANGGIPALLSIAGWIVGSDYGTVAALCAISAATSDTWATEIGRLTQWPPRSIVTRERVPVGTSGAVSLPGTVASLTGALAIGGFSAIGAANHWMDVGNSASVMFALVAVAGVAGSFLDSLLGATVQELFMCNSCGKRTESGIHDCGANATRIGGIPGINNDIVNLVSTSVPPAIVVLILFATS